MNTTFNTTSTSSAVSLRPIARGGVTSAQGFTAAGVHAGFRKNPGRADLALGVGDRPLEAQHSRPPPLPQPASLPPTGSAQPPCR